jgi:hypothetical protein
VVGKPSLPLCLLPADGALGFLSTAAALRQLDLSGCRELSSEGMAPLAALSHLHCLKLQHCTGLRGAAALAPLSSLVALTALSLAGCTSLTGLALKALGCVSPPTSALLLVSRAAQAHRGSGCRRRLSGRMTSRSGACQ